VARRGGRNHTTEISDGCTKRRKVGMFLQFELVLSPRRVGVILRRNLRYNTLSRILFWLYPQVLTLLHLELDRSCARQTLLGELGTRRSTKRLNGCDSVVAEITMSDPQLQYQQKSWTTSSTSYTTQKMRLGTAASSLNHGSRAPENTFSPISSSPPKKACSHGRRRFQIL
jgi:hypothetical protein